MSIWQPTETESEDEPWQPIYETSDEENQAPEEGPTKAELWFEEMKILLLNRTITAQMFCTLVYNATHESNGANELSKYAKYGLKPNSSSGDYQRKLRKTMPMYVDAKPNYDLELAVNRKDELGRTTMEFPVMLPQEELEEELAGIPNWKEDLKRAIETKQLPKIYEEHPIVQQNELGTVLPIGIFIDGIPYSKVDELEGYWIINMLTNRRHFIIGLRNTLKCKCSCKGWCSHWEIFNFLNWQLESLAEQKTFKTARWQGVAKKR